jgi:hypothetical protein
LLAHLEQHVQSGTVVVFPRIVYHLVVELFVVVFTVAEVNNKIVIFVLGFQKLGHVFDSISIRLLET